MDEWFGTLLLLTQVNEGPGDGFPKNSPENLPMIFAVVFAQRQWIESRKQTPRTWSK